MTCQTLYFCNSAKAVVKCEDPFAFPAVVTGKLCSVVVHLCDYHGNAFRSDGYIVDFAEPELTGMRPA